MYPKIPWQESLHLRKFRLLGWQRFRKSWKRYSP